jgi:hypothetical protein
MTEETPEEQTEPKALETKTPVKDDVKKGGVTRTVLLAVPLFCKFAIVLFIKFLTDVIVFPLLFLYRMARLSKRKLLRLFSNENNHLNGDSSKLS